LFDLFDFNDIMKITVRDLEFMIECCLTSTAKMYGLGEDFTILETSKLIKDTFPEGISITLP